MKIENTVIRLPGIKKEYRFLHIADVHVAYAGENESESDKLLAENETKYWSRAGVTPLEAWEMMEEYVKAQSGGIDGLLIAGDCLNYYSAGNLEWLKKKIEAFPAAVLYTPGNHELMVYGDGQPDISKNYREYYDAAMGCNADFQVRDYEDFLIIGINNAQKEITQEQLEKLKEQIARNVPIILLMHIPLQTKEVLDAVEKRWGERNPYFLFEANEHASEFAREFSRIVRQPESNVAVILAGHIHAAHEGEFALGRAQYTAAPLHDKYIRKIKIVSSVDGERQDN